MLASARRPSSALPAMLGLSPPASRRVSDVADVIGPEKFAALDRDPDAAVIYLSTATAERPGRARGATSSTSAGST